jgi:hypothetical protein
MRCDGGTHSNACTVIVSSIPEIGKQVAKTYTPWRAPQCGTLPVACPERGEPKLIALAPTYSRRTFGAGGDLHLSGRQTSDAGSCSHSATYKEPAAVDDHHMWRFWNCPGARYLADPKPRRYFPSAVNCWSR